MKNNSDVKILIIDDEEMIRQVLHDSLVDDGFQVETAKDGTVGLTQIRNFKPDIVLLDIWMPGKDGLEVLQESKRNFPPVQIIMMSGHGTIETAVKATKMGAWDFVEKPLSMDKITILISNILAYQAERGEKQTLLNKLRKNIAVIGDSPAMKSVKELISRVAPSDSWVLITGPNGAGKELIAQNIHYQSQRAGGPFIEVNCAAIPEELIESELFGHEEGAFTGATSRKLGKFELAHNGTIFLDEIADMSLKTQAKILRILEEQTFERVGGQTSLKVNVRVLAATNKDLKEEIKEGRFREDLYHRLNVIPLSVPKLSERLEDLPALTIHFAQEFAKRSGRLEKRFTADALIELQKYDWPGNVRELRNFVERVYILSPDEEVSLEVLKAAGLVATESGELDIFTDFDSLREARASFEKQFIIQKLEENSGNISKTAEMIGVERSHLHRKIKAFGIDVRESEI